NNNNNNNNIIKLRNDFIKNFNLDSNNNNNIIINGLHLKKDNNIEILVEKFPLPPQLLINNDDININDVDELVENLKKFNKPWEFAPEVASKEMNTVKVLKSGRIIEINPETWSSVVKDACVQSNYPFYVPLPPTSKKVVSETLKEEIINDKILKE